MPELPEVDTVRCGLIPLCVGQTVVSVTIHQPQLRWPIPSILPELLTGQNIEAIERRSKYLLMHTAIGTLIMHLGMTGVCRVLPNDAPLIKHDHFVMAFSNETSLRFNDSRRFGAILWTHENPYDHPLIKSLGPEPLSNAFNTDHVMALCRNRRVAIKTWLMNGHHVVGVGNIYASESLFSAGIHPLTPAGAITISQADKLITSVKHILAAAITAGGTTLRDFKNTDGKPGYFGQSLQVYGRAGEPCYQCGHTIEKLVIGQRSSFYCPTCQQ